MANEAVRREVRPDGAVQLLCSGCTFVYRRPRWGVLIVTINGHDVGQFGTAPLDEIVAAMHRERPLELYIDAREAFGADPSISEDWTRFFITNRSNLRQVHILVGSKFIYLTVAIAQHRSHTDDLIQVYTDPAAFEARLRAVLP